MRRCVDPPLYELDDAPITATTPVPFMTADDFDRITTTLDTLRQRLNRRDAGEAAWASAISLLIGVLLALGTSLTLGPRAAHWGWLPLVIAAASSAWFQWRLFLRPRRRRADDAQMARWLERQAPTLRSGVITAVQARAAMRESAPWPGLSEPLAHRSATLTAQALEALELSALVDERRLRTLTRWGLMVLLFTSATVVSRPELTRHAALQLIEPSQDTLGLAGVGREVDTLVSDLALSLRFPAYLERQRREIPRTGGDFSALVGTEVTLKGRLVEPAGIAMLELESDPGSRWPMTLEAGELVTGALVVGASDRYRFLIATPGGELVREAGWRVVDAREDAPPTVRLLLPERDLEVNPSDDVPMIFEATDDHGLGDIELVVQRRDGGEALREHIRNAAGERRANGPTTLSMSGLQLLAGEAVDVWFEARDQRDTKAASYGRSASRRITIYSPEAEHAERLTELSAIIDALILLLAERLESPLAESADADLPLTLRTQLTITGATALVLRGLEALIGAMSTDTLASASMLDTLRSLLDALSTHHEMEEAQLRLLDSGRSPRQRPTQVLKILIAHNEEGIGIVERSAWTLKELLDEARQRQVLAQGRDLLDAQEALMEHLKAMKEAGATELSREAKRTLDELDATLRRMEEELAQLVEHSPYENQNLSKDPSEDEEDVRSLRDRLKEVRQLMAEGRHDEAAALLEELQRETQELMAALQGDFDLKAPDQEHSKALSEFDLKLGELANEQAGLTRETEEEEGRLSAEQEAALEAQLAKEMAAVKELAKRLREAADAVESAPLHPRDQAMLAELRRQAEQTQRSVETLAAERARAEATEVEQNADNLGREIGESEAREAEQTRRDKLREVIRDLDAVKEVAGELAEALEQITPRPPKPTSARRREANKLGKRQKRIERAMNELESHLEGVDQTLPGLGEALLPSMQEAKEAMRSAADELGEVRPGEAAGHQRRAMERLEAMKGSIDKRVKDSSGQAGGGPGIHRRDQRVEIPEQADPSKQKALRDALLKAMKERAPERYEEAIERYYEELVR